jgi:hypothetical protein
MRHVTVRGRRWPTAVLLALAVLAIGSVFATARNGDAASLVAPNNTAPPVVTGTTTVGSTLTTTNGTFTGTTPLTYTYAWSRCDATGGSCATISGATDSTYVLKSVDAGNTLRSVVTATNPDGSDHGTSVPTGVVAAAPVAPATGCPTGTGPIQVTDLTLPARLAISGNTVTPNPITPAASSIQVKYTVTACGGRPVQGALVYTSAVPFNQYSTPAEASTGADGTATLTMNQRAGFPAARQQQLLVVYVRARKSGDPIGGGVSSSLLTSFPVKLNG